MTWHFSFILHQGVAKSRTNLSRSCGFTSADNDPYISMEEFAELRQAQGMVGALK